MNIYIYSDESGVLDKFHNKYFVFGGLIFLSREEKDKYSRRYIATEKVIRKIEGLDKGTEVKAFNISNKSKNKLYRSINSIEKFGIIIHQKELLDNLFDNKKGKQRYLDWAYKMAVKAKFQELISQQKIVASEVEHLCFFVDEHATATNGIYELRESLEQEFKFGTYHFEWSVFHPPIFPNLKSVELRYCNSATKTLVRAADIVANHIYFLANKNEGIIEEKNNLRVIYHPNIRK